VSCLLSLRTKDTTTFPACLRLFNKARTAKQVIALSQEELEKLIYPVGFYRRKATLLHTISNDILYRFNGKVPNTETELLSIPGVGRKTANLVLGEAFNIPAMCVDTHVHRISNRLGLVNTDTPEETEIALKAIVPREYWIEYNRLLVMWGQNICTPISPWCSQCPVYDECERIDVFTKR
jgi:endonuclease III